VNRFKNKETENIYEGIIKKGVSIKVMKIAKIKIINILIAGNLKNLLTPPSNNLEKLKGDREGQYSIRVNEKYRICFEWINNEPFNIEFVDYHK
jgi:proteic killer suppression protein